MSQENYLQARQTKELIPTLDGSLTLHLAALDELYHNRAGAFSEAQIDYSSPALNLLKQQAKESCTVLDGCFGLGYNSFAFLQELLLARTNGELGSLKTLRIEAIDNDPSLKPLLKRVLLQPCFADLNEDLPALPLHLESGSATFITGNLTIQFSLYIKDLRDYLREPAGLDSPTFDFIFHDAFAPKKATELWTIDFFELYLRRLHKTGAILTYSCAPAVRGALRELGLNLFVTPALGSKSGGTLATRQDLLNETVLSLTRMTAQDEKRLAGAGKVPYRDPHFKLLAEQIKEARLAEQRLLDDARSQ